MVIKKLSNGKKLYISEFYFDVVYHCDSNTEMLPKADMGDYWLDHMGKLSKCVKMCWNYNRKLLNRNSWTNLVYSNMIKTDEFIILEEE